MAEAAVSNILQLLATLVTKEAMFLWGVEGLVKEMQSELEWIQCFLSDAEARQTDERRVHKWVLEIRDIAYDIEDVIDTFRVRIASRRKEGCANAIKRYTCIFKEATLLHKVRSEMEDIRNRIKNLNQQLDNYGVKHVRLDRETSSNSRVLIQRQPYPHLLDDVVGLETLIEELVCALEDKDVRAVSLCGMGGIGKTTLAKKVYQHQRVRSYFQHSVWINVSQQCDQRVVWRKILSSLEPGFNFQKKDIQELAARLHELLEERRCLVILDDVWGTRDLESLKPGFPLDLEDTQSKFILTSRHKEVALRIARRVHFHELQCLNDEDSRKLFQKVAFSQRKFTDERVDGRIEEVGKKIVKYGKGLPLAIIAIAGTLAGKNYTYQDWKKVHDNIKSYFRRGKMNTVLEVMALSYNDLPSHLKPCFLYLALFPEDYEIPVGKLIRMWVAEGFIPPEVEDQAGTETMEDVAESYLIELINRCMVQAWKIGANSKVVTCRMHDIVREHCLLKAKEENFACLLEDMGTNYGFNAVVADGTIRRLGINASNNIIGPIKHPHIRSLLFFCPLFDLDKVSEESCLVKCIQQVNDNVILSFVPRLIIFSLALCEKHLSMSHLFENCKQLRVLELEDDDSITCSMPRKIENLIHLRYLSFNRSGACCKLPTSLGELRLLQTLDLELAKEIQVPNVIWRMEKLRHLYLPEVCIIKTKLRLSNLRNLQTLINFPIGKCDVEQLFTLTNLRELSMMLFQDPVSGSTCFGKCLCCCCRCVISREANQMPLGIDQESISKLGELPKLRILKLKEAAFQGTKLVFSSASFQQLESLTLESLRELQELEVKQGALPSLGHLRIDGCGKMRTVPVVLSSNSNLSLELG